MGAYVSLQVGVHDELLRAVWTFKVLTGGVCPKVELKIGGVCKALIAVCALERSLTRMGAFVLHRGRQQEERGDKRRGEFMRYILFVCWFEQIAEKKKLPE